MNIVIIAIILFCIIAIVLIWAKRHSSDINDYFVNAVRVYILLDKEDAKIAALAAAKVAGAKQRESMVNYLIGMESDVAREFPDHSAMTTKLFFLKERICAANWNMRDIVEEKNRLADYNPAYLKALNKADANIFVRKYPDLFKDKKT
jgi:hypothetical protein